MKTKQKSQNIRSVGFRSLQIESNLVVVEGLFTNMTLLLIGIAVLRAPTSPNDPSQSWHCLCGRPELQRQTLQCTSAGIRAHGFDFVFPVALAVEKLSR